MESILELARQLGREIRRHERFQQLAAAEKTVMADEQASLTHRQLEGHARKIAELQFADQPVGLEDRKKLQELREKAHANPQLQELARARADYMELMSKVNEALEEGLHTSSIIV